MTLPIQTVVSVGATTTPPLLGTDPFGRGLIIGSSANARVAPNVLYGIYHSTEGVKADYGLEAPEYKIAKRYFAQIPTPKSVMIATVDAAAAVPTASFYFDNNAQSLALTPNDGDVLAVTVNGTLFNSLPYLIEIDIYNWVLDALRDAGLDASFTVSDTSAELAVVTWTVNAPLTGSQVVSISSPSTSRVLLSSTESTPTPTNPITFTVGSVGGAQTGLQQIESIWDATQSFYGFCFADGVPAAQMQDVVDWAQSHFRLPFFVLTDSAEAISTVNTINGLNYLTHCTTYHNDPLDVGAIMAMALDQKFDQPNGIKTLMFKRLIGVTTTPIGETLAGQLKAAGVNYYTSYGNPDDPVVMFANGHAGGGKFVDFVMGLHWLRNSVQVEVFNLFLINPKVDQTDAGQQLVKAGAARKCSQGADNGLIAAGQWNGPSIGTINTGDWLPNGYYIYADTLRNQSQQDRELRKGQPITIIFKGAGALHGADIMIIGEQ
jgi:hypothetical protein